MAIVRRRAPLRQERFRAHTHTHTQNEVKRGRRKKKRCSESCGRCGWNGGRVINAQQKPADPGARLSTCQASMAFVRWEAPWSRLRRWCRFLQQTPAAPFRSLSSPSVPFFFVLLFRTLNPSLTPPPPPPSSSFVAAFVRVSRLQPPFLLSSVEREQAC